MTNKTSKSDIVKQIAENTNISQKDVDAVLSNFFSSIKDNLNQDGDNVSFVGFGSFSVKRREAREGRNPKNGEKIQIPAKNVVKFKAGKDLEEGVN